MEAIARVCFLTYLSSTLSQLLLSCLQLPQKSNRRDGHPLPESQYVSVHAAHLVSSLEGGTRPCNKNMESAFDTW